MTLFLLFFAVSTYATQETGKLEIGDKAELTDIKMLDVSGEQVSIDDIKKENGVLVLFSCNTCPFVMRWEERYPGFKEYADKYGVGMIVLNSNYQNRDGDDSYQAMKKKANEKNYNFHYVVDEDSRIANAFGGQTTPHAFLFNSDMELVYKGAVDDNYKSEKEVKSAYLKDAIKSVATGKEVAVAESKPVGCSIKRKMD